MTRTRVASDPSRRGNAQFRVASQDYFEAMEIPLLRGRTFDARDTRDAPHVAVINASLAELHWPGQDPLGRLIQFAGMDGDYRAFTIVGIVADIRELALGGDVAADILRGPAAATSTRKRVPYRHRERR